jgi:hypothetical protein
MQDESISTINVYDLERAARRQAYEECAAICEGEAKVWDDTDIVLSTEFAKICHENAATIRAKLETMP